MNKVHFVIDPAHKRLAYVPSTRTKRQAGELISGPGQNAKAKLMSFNRTQCRAVIGLLNGHNTLRRPLHKLGLTDSPLCRKCRVEEETSGNIICK